MILAITNQKGGTGKSTLATNLAVCFARTGAEVLLVDADPQHSALDWRADRPDAVPLIHVVGLPVDNLHREIPPLAACRREKAMAHYKALRLSVVDHLPRKTT